MSCTCCGGAGSRRDLPSAVGKPCLGLYPKYLAVLSSSHRQAGKLLEDQSLADAPGFHAGNLRLETYLLVQSCCPEAEELISPAPVTIENQAAAMPSSVAAANNASGSFSDVLATKISKPPAAAATASRSQGGAAAASADTQEKSKPGAAPVTAAKDSPNRPEKKKPEQSGTSQTGLFGLVPLQAVAVPAANPRVAVNPTAVTPSASSPAAEVSPGSQQEQSSASNPALDQKLIHGSPYDSPQPAAFASPARGAIAVASETAAWSGAEFAGNVPSGAGCLPGAPSGDPSAAAATSETSGALTKGNEPSATEENSAAQGKRPAATRAALPSLASLPGEGGSASTPATAGIAAQAAADQAKASDANGSNGANGAHGGSGSNDLAHPGPGTAAGSKPGTAIAAPVASQEPAAGSATQAATLSAASAPSLAVTLEPQKSSADNKVKAVAQVDTGGAALKPELPTKTTAPTPPGATTHGGKRADTAPAEPAQAAPGDADENPRPTSAANDAALAGKDQPAPPATGHAAPGATQAASPAIPLTDARQSVLLNPATNPGSHGSGQPAGASPPADIPAPLPSMVSTAHVLERMGHSEMRVDVNTADFGNIQLHTSVSQDRVGASINTTHLDLRTAMMAEAPSLQQALEQHHLRLGQLDLGTQAGERQGGGAPQQQPRSQTGWQSGFAPPQPGDTPRPRSQDSPAPSLWTAPGSSRLNIHA